MSQIQLPADDGFIPDVPVQWWYWTGHLHSAASGRWYGFETVFFAISKFVPPAVEPEAVQEPPGAWEPVAFVGQCAITDIAERSFHYVSQLTVSLLEQLPGRFVLVSDNATANGGNGHDKIVLGVDGYDANLELTQQRPPVRHYGGNEHAYSFGGYTYYYSRELMSVSGTLAVPGPGGSAGVAEPVEGIAWFDRQWGNLADAVEVGWSWFSIQLDNDMQLMFAVFGNAPDESFGSVTGTDGCTDALAHGDFDLETFMFWKSPTSNRWYPSGWRITSPTAGGIALEVSPAVTDQELSGGPIKGPTYWEGACTVTGTIGGVAVKGKSYVELEPGWKIHLSR